MNRLARAGLIVGGSFGGAAGVNFANGRVDYAILLGIVGVVIAVVCGVKTDLDEDRCRRQHARASVVINAAVASHRAIAGVMEADGLGTIYKPLTEPWIPVMQSAAQLDHALDEWRS